VDERIDVFAERAGGNGVVEVADDTGRGCGVVEEFLEGGSAEGELVPVDYFGGEGGVHANEGRLSFLKKLQKLSKMLRNA
jgi:hypothetical protein